MDIITVQALALALQVNRPVVLEGTPGLGKTRIIPKLGEILGLPTVIFTPSCREGAMIGGYPVPRPSRDGIDLLPLYSLVWPLLKAGKGILFLDELNTAERDMRVALRSVILEKRFGDIQLPSEVAMAGAMNPTTLGDAEDLGAALSNRIIRLSWIKDTTIIRRALLTCHMNGNNIIEAAWGNLDNILVLEKDWRKHIPSSGALIAGFLERFPDLVDQCPVEISRQSEPWPSPRIWLDYVVPCLAATISLGLAYDSPLTLKLIAGCVGEQVALTLLEYITRLDLLPPEETHKSGIRYDHKRPDRTVATVMCYISWLGHNNNIENWKRAMGHLTDLAKVSVDVAALGVGPLMKLKGENYPSIESFNPQTLKIFTPLLEL